MKNFFYISILVLLVVNNSYAQKNLTLNEAVSIALSKNTALVKSQNSISTQELGIKTAFGNFFPNLNLGGSWSWQRTSDDGGTQLNYFGQEQNIPPSQIDSRSWSLSANGSVTLFDGLANYANLSQKKNNFESAKYDFEKLKQDVILQTASLYFTVISFDELLKFQEENYNYNVSLLDKIREMKELKMIPVSDVYSQEVQTANSESSLLQVKNNFEKAKISLLNYLALDISEEYKFSSAEVGNLEIDFAEHGLDKLYELAFQKRMDYQTQKLILENAKLQLTIARADYLPSLSGNYRFSTSALDPGNLFNRRIYGFGLSINIPVFSRWTTDYSVQSAKVQIENANEDLLNLERSIKSEVKNVLLDLQTAEKQVDVTSKAILSAQESWKIKKESYEIGKLTYIDLQQSYRDLLQAQNNSVQAVYALYSTKYQLLNKLGLLNQTN